MGIFKNVTTISNYNFHRLIFIICFYGPENKVTPPLFFSKKRYLKNFNLYSR
jgi:hypothetical protein